MLGVLLAFVLALMATARHVPLQVRGEPSSSASASASGSASGSKSASASTSASASATASLAPYILLQAGPGVYLDKFLNQPKDISLQPSFFIPLKFDGKSYTEEMFWATMTEGNGNVTQVVRFYSARLAVHADKQCTVQVTETLSATATVDIITSTPYVSATWPSPAPATPTATCSSPGPPFAYIGIPGYATARNKDNSISATAGSGMFDCWMGLGKGSTTVETWSITRTSTFTCGTSTTQIPVPDLLVSTSCRVRQTL